MPSSPCCAGPCSAGPAASRAAAGPPRALFALDEAQAFAPAGAPADVLADTFALTAEAGARGLGLLFATQSPTWLPDAIPVAAGTLLFGRLNALAQVDAARRMAAAVGGDAAEISRLGVGEFYAVSDGVPFQRLTTPLSLSYHPGWPLTPDDIAARARPH
jgi:DNA helicase HerA-like ATPase